MTANWIAVTVFVGCLAVFCQPRNVQGAEKPPAADTPGADKKSAPADTTRYTVTLDDNGTLTGVIVRKTPAQWVIQADDGQQFEIARARVRQVRIAPPLEERKKEADHPQGDRPQGNKPHDDKPQSDRPHGDKPQGEKPQGDKPQGDRPQVDRPQGDQPNAKLEVPAERGPHPRVTLHLKDGRTVSGTVEKRGDHGLVIKTDKGERVEIRQDQVKSVE